MPIPTELPHPHNHFGWRPERGRSPHSDDHIDVPPGLLRAPRASSVDLREGFPSQPLNQAPHGTCTACSAAALFEYFEHRTQGRNLVVSPRFLYYVTRLLMQEEPGNGSQGITTRKAMQALVTLGIAPEKFWPYKGAGADSRDPSFTAMPTTFVYAVASSYRAERYARVDIADERTGPPSQRGKRNREPQELLDVVRQLLDKQKRPSMFGVTTVLRLKEGQDTGKAVIDFAFNGTPGGVWPSPTDEDAALYQKALAEEKLPADIGFLSHAMVACGYDDTKVCVDTSGNSAKTRGALLVRNSWSTEWGEGGYGWVPYDYVLKGMSDDWWTIFKTSWSADETSFEQL